MGSPERKRCSNMAPVRRLRSLAWIKARRLPGVRCSTLKTECRSLLCLMIMPGRSWVAGIAIAGQFSLNYCDCIGGRRQTTFPAGYEDPTHYFTRARTDLGTGPRSHEEKRRKKPRNADPG